MALLETPFTVSASSRVGFVLKRMGRAMLDLFESMAEARSHAAEFEYYNAMSDEELAKIGLTRTTIASHVFRHYFT